jgi:anti-sigma factor RsiW
MMDCQEITTRLSAYIDGALPPAERGAVAAHLDACSGCRGVVRDLERVRAAARQLGPIAPPDHLILEIAGQIRLEQAPAPAPDRHVPAMPVPRRRHVALEWLGLAAALVIITIGAYLFVRQPLPAEPAAGNAAANGSVQSVTDELQLAMQHYENAIAELEKLARSDTGDLDPAVAEAIALNIRAIDQAIAESRGALTNDPQSEPARESLFDALRRKVGALQATVNLVNEMRQGNTAGAAAAAAGLSKKG